MLISEVLENKGSRDVVTIGPQATVRELLLLLSEHNVGAAVVSADGTQLAGIVSERDVVRHLVDDEQLLSAEVATIMTEALHTCVGADTVNDLMALMTEHRVRHIPVVDDRDAGAVVGVVSIGDVVKSRMSELEFERDQLDSYVHG